MKISNAEWPILAALWKRPSSAASELLPLIENNRFSTNLGTLRTHLRRLVNKDLVSQTKEGKRYLYSANLTMRKAVTQEIDLLLENIPPQAQSIALLHMLKKSTLKPADLKKIQREFDKQNTKKTR